MNTARVTVNADQGVSTINPNIYGHFAEHLGHCVDRGIWVGEESHIPNVRGIRTDVVEALRRIKPRVVRWPGGCFADDYHWRDGIGPREQRPKRVNAHWGMVIEENQFGTHEFIDFCRQIGAAPYICGNVGSGAVAELRDWLEYCNFDGASTLAEERAANGSPEPFIVKYWGVGNENWGCGGRMSPEYYANEVKRYSTFLPAFGKKQICRIACGPSGDDAAWTRRFFETLAGVRDGCPRSHIGCIDAFAAHYYCRTSGNATEYSEAEWCELLRKALAMERLVVRHRAIMDGLDPERRVGLIVDEWGTWHPVIEGTHPRFLRQQNSIRDALVAALTLDVFNRHADKVVMANIAQTINVLQAMCLTDGPRMFCTPTYHVYEMYAVHQGGRSVPVRIDAEPVTYTLEGKEQRIPRVAGSASVREGELALSLVNTHAAEPAAVEIHVRGVRATAKGMRVLAADDIHAHNDFDAPNRVKPQDAELPGFRLELAPASVNVLAWRVE